MKMRKCPSCKIYTLKENCHRCNRPTVGTRPPSFSPQDKYGKYRREMRK